MVEKHEDDPAMIRVRSQFEESDLTLEELGTRMGYPPETARKSAWQFIRQTGDPRISMLRRFASALEIPLEQLIAEKKRRSK